MNAAFWWMLWMITLPFTATWQRPQEILLGLWLFSFSLILGTGGELLFHFQGTMTAILGMVAGVSWVWRGIKGDENKDETYQYNELESLP